jgi:hypothetical protein
MKLLLMLAFLLVSNVANAIPRTVPYILTDQITTDGFWESQPMRLASSHRYAFHLQSDIGVTITTYISGNCVDWIILTAVSAVSTGDDIVQVTNANYPCVKLRVATLAPVTALGFVKEGV